MQDRPFTILTVGWEPQYIDYFAVPIANRTQIRFVHGLVGDMARLEFAKKLLPAVEFVALSKSKAESLPAPDLELLASLESVGIPTIRSMIQGDRALRFRPPEESLSYATLIARRTIDVLKEMQPDVVLGSFDSLHAAISLAVSKSLGIPWVAMAFPVIPDNLMGFCKGMTPDTLVPIATRNGAELRSAAAEIICALRSNRQRVLAYRPPSSVAQRMTQMVTHTRNFLRRATQSSALGYDRFTWPTVGERLADIVRRSANALKLPKSRMIGAPPRGRYAYFPLHMAPESSVDTWAPLYQDQLGFVFQLAQSLPIDMEFVVKIHFGDPDNYSRKQLLELMKLPRLSIARPDASSFAFLKDAALVIGIQGTASLEAALLGKPVLIFGDSPYQHFPRTERAARPDDVYKQIQRMLMRPPPSDTEVAEAYASYMARYMPGRINDWGRVIESEEIERLCGCFQALREFVTVPTNRDNWYLTSPFVAYG
jgi:hypothetical protein